MKLLLSSFFVSVVVTWILEFNKGSFIKTSSTYHDYHRNQQLLVILEDVLPGFLEDPFGSRNTQTVKEVTCHLARNLVQLPQSKVTPTHQVSM